MNKPYECQNCGQRWLESELNPVPMEGLFERVGPGEPMPAGECPSCGALCHESAPDPPPPDDITILEAIENAILMLEHNGLHGGDVYDDLKIVERKLRTKHRAIGAELLGAQ